MFKMILQATSSSTSYKVLHSISKNWGVIFGHKKHNAKADQFQYGERISIETCGRDTTILGEFIRKEDGIDNICSLIQLLDEKDVAISLYYGNWSNGVLGKVEFSNIAGNTCGVYDHSFAIDTTFYVYMKRRYVTEIREHWQCNRQCERMLAEVIYQYLFGEEFGGELKYCEEHLHRSLLKGYMSIVGAVGDTGEYDKMVDFFFQCRKM